MLPIFTITVPQRPATFEEAVEQLCRFYVGKQITSALLHEIKTEVSNLSHFYFNDLRYRAVRVGIDSIEINKLPGDL